MKAALALDRASGAILKTSGQISAIQTSKTSAATLPSQPAGSFSNEANAQPDENQGAEELARLVWRFVTTAGNLVQELDTDVRCTSAAP